MTKTKIVDGIEIELTAEEEAQRDQEEADWNNDFDRTIKELRNKRNKLLAETDWMANSDVTMSDDWKTYRQELRDLPSGLTTAQEVSAVTFPTKP